MPGFISLLGECRYTRGSWVGALQGVDILRWGADIPAEGVYLGALYQRQGSSHTQVGVSVIPTLLRTDIW